ncbi:MAG: PEGA domain-containing protein [Betaproteobacteria bacterium]
MRRFRATILFAFPRSPSLHTDAAGWTPPDAFGPFRVLHQIGAGALGPVFRAYEPERDRVVAVKLFRLNLPPERVHRLVAAFERLIGADLKHPTVVAPIATGIVDNEAYLVQSCVAADSLDAAIRNHGPVPAADAARVASQLAGALDFAAVVGVLHGGLHPRDVLLSPEELHLTGLGVSAALEQTGVTPPVRRPYAAPERVAGVAWDRRADVFSLAVVMFEMLWGRRVAGAGGHTAETLTELPGADMEALRAVFGRALAEDPAARFPTALAFAGALNEAVGTVAAPSVDLLVPAVQSIEPLLPLDEPEPARGEPDLRIRPAEAEPLEATPARDEPAVLTPGRISARHPPSPARERFAERARSAVWPLMLALIVGLAIGFAAGYGAGARDHAQGTTAPAATAPEATAEAPAQPAAPAAAQPASSENAVGEPSLLTVGARATGARPADLQPAPPPATSAEHHAAPIETGRVLVRSTPPGAAVYVDGRERGRTPAAIFDLRHGEHLVRVVRDGYVPEERRVELTASRPADSMTVLLQREGSVRPVPSDATGITGVLVVESLPSGAAVFVDGHRIGTTPLSVTRVDAGEHAVRLERPGYRGWAASVRIVAGARNRVTASLER